MSLLSTMDSLSATEANELNGILKENNFNVYVASVDNANIDSGEDLSVLATSIMAKSQAQLLGSNTQLSGNILFSIWHPCD